MQLCLLLLPQASRARLHTVTRLIHDAAHNKELILSRSKTNFDEVVTLPSPYWWRMSDVIYYCLQSMLLSLVHTTTPPTFTSYLCTGPQTPVKMWHVHLQLGRGRRHHQVCNVSATSLTVVITPVEATYTM